MRGFGRITGRVTVRQGVGLLASSLALVALLTLLAVGAAGAQTPADSLAADPLVQVEDLLRQAAKLNARRVLPTGYRNVEKRLEDAQRSALAADDMAALLVDARRLANQAEYLRSLEDARSPLEAIANRFDLTLYEVAHLEDLPFDRGTSGEKAAAQLLAQLAQIRRTRRAQTDSLRVQLANLQETAVGRVAAQDSLITSLRVEISDLRRRLWETELRAGVAEADRSAAESALRRRQAREAAVKEIGTDLGEQNGTVILTPGGDIVLQVHGLQFGVGSTQLKEGQNKLLDKLAAAIGRFPGAGIRVEGHTDDTGSRNVNLDLSQKRATTVAQALARRLKVDPQVIVTVGHGPDRPLASNATDAGRARNRRIDVVITPAP